MVAVVSTHGYHQRSLRDQDNCVAATCGVAVPTAARAALAGLQDGRGWNNAKALAGDERHRLSRKCLLALPCNSAHP